MRKSSNVDTGSFASEMDSVDSNLSYKRRGDILISSLIAHLNTKPQKKEKKWNVRD